MRSISLSILFGLLFLGCSNQYGDIETHTVVSTTNGTSYKIEVLKPYGYNASTNYPIIYLLDGRYYLSTLDGILADLSDDNLINDVIVVGINYTNNDNRNYDYFYPQATIDIGFSSGGGELFHTFLRDELIPFIDARYTSNANERTIMGHSAGGFFVLYSLFHHYQIGTTPFTNFVSVSSGSFWEDGYIFGEEIATRAATPDLNVSLYMSVGTLEVPANTASFNVMKTQILSSGYNNLSLKTNTFEKGHGSIMPSSVRDSLKYLFGK